MFYSPSVKSPCVCQRTLYSMFIPWSGAAVGTVLLASLCDGRYRDITGWAGLGSSSALGGAWQAVLLSQKQPVWPIGPWLVRLQNCVHVIYILGKLPYPLIAGELG